MQVVEVWAELRDVGSCRMGQRNLACRHLFDEACHLLQKDRQGEAKRGLDSGGTRLRGTSVTLTKV